MSCADCRNFEPKEPKKLTNGTWTLEEHHVNLKDDTGRYVGSIWRDTGILTASFKKFIKK